MSAEDIGSVVERAREQLRDRGEFSERTVQLRVVEPIVEALGWDLRGGEVVADRSVGGVRVDYALTVAGDPAVVVETCRLGADLRSATDPVVDALEESAVEWGVASDGREFVLLTATRGTVERLVLDLEELPDRPDALAQYERETVRERHDREDRIAGRRLRTNRDRATRAVAEALLAVTDDAGREPIETAAEEFVDDLVESLDGGGDPGENEVESVGEEAEAAEEDANSAGVDAGSAEEDAKSAGVDAGSAGLPNRDGPLDDSPADADETTAERGGENDTDTAPQTRGPSEGPAGRVDQSGGETTSSDERSGGEDAEGAGLSGEEDPTGDDVRPATTENGPGTSGAETAQQADGGEYVVRFFSGTSSVGAVGSGSPGGTLASAIEYLASHHAIARRLSLPWGLDDGEPLLARERMEGSRDLGDGTYVRTDVDAGTARRAVDVLADRAGLRVMFQGDW